MKPDTVDIALNGNFTASEMEEILRDLAKARAGMRPAVPGSLEGAALTDAESFIEVAPAFQFSTLANGGLRIHLRSSGLGWLAFEIGAAQRTQMLALIADQVTDTRRAH